MGQEIVYCFRCQKRILGSEFAKGQAYQIGDNASCGACAKELLQTLGPREREEFLAKIIKATQDRQNPAGLARTPSASTPALSSSSTRTKAAQGGKPDHRKTTTQIPIVRPRTVVSRSSSSPLLWGTLAGAAAFVAVLGFALSGGSRTPPEPSGSGKPPDRGTTSPPTDSSERSTEETRRMDAARIAFDKAKDFEKTHPQDFGPQIDWWEKAQWAADKTSLFEPAKRELARVQAARRDQISKELSELEESVAPRLKAEEYKAASDLFQAARSRHNLLDWAFAIDKRSREVYDTAAQLYPALKEKAVFAQKHNQPAEVQAIRARVQKWNFPELTTDLEAAIASTIPETPPPPPKPRSKEAQAYQARWEAALAKARLRDYPGAVDELRRGAEPLTEPGLKAEAAADLEAFRSAGLALSEGLDSLAKAPKGQKLTFAYRNPTGMLERLEGAVVEANAGFVTLRQDDAVTAVPLGEITPTSIAELYRAKRDKPPADRASALLCLFEGDPGAARRILEKEKLALSEKYWSGAAPASDPKNPVPAAEREAAARKLFYSAEEGLFDFSKILPSIGSYKTLLAEFSGTAFVARNGAAITRRLGIGKDYFFFPDMMKGAGTFRMAKGGKWEASWTSDRDSDSSKLPENYVELAYSAIPDTEYRGWVYAGGCCQETFQSSLQSTDLKVPNPKNPKEIFAAEPGSSFSVPLKSSYLLRKTHAMHLGPKSPSHWEWIPLSIPKESAPGVKTVRILTCQKGFSVGFVLISAQRTSPPSETDLKEIERSRLRDSVPVRDPSLVGYWKLDEGEGNTAGDSSGNGLAGVLRNGPTWTTGRRGKALSFNGINQYVELGNSPKFCLPGPFSVVAWVNPASLGGQYRYILSDYSERGADSSFALRLEASGQVSFFWENPSQVEPKAISKATLAVGTWAHVAGVWDGTRRKIYVNGVLEGSDATAQERPPTIAAVSIGRPGAYHGFYAAGAIDDVRIYARNLSDPEIVALAKGIREKERVPVPVVGVQDDRPWTPVFDGRSLASLEAACLSGWKLEDGKIVHIIPVDNAAQVTTSFPDNLELRIFLESTNGDPWFSVKGWVGSRRRVRLSSADLPPGMHELRILCKGLSVTATIDGKPATVGDAGPPPAENEKFYNCLQFNTQRGAELRIKSIEFRPLR